MDTVKPLFEALYRGRPASELTREELLTAYRWAVRELQSYREMWERETRLQKELDKTQMALRRFR